MGGHIAGVLFFRWANGDEALALHPTEVLAAAGVRPADAPRHTVRTVSRGCAAVSCVDLYYEGAAPWSPEPLRRRVMASAPLAYFLPEKDVPVRMAGRSAIELSIPPYCARGRIYLGRAVSDRPVEFRIEELP